MAISFSQDSELITPTVDGQTYLGGGGNDVYVINDAAPPFGIGAGDAVTIDDDGENTIRLVGGLSITSSLVYHNFLQLKLSNGAEVNILHADEFSYDVGTSASDPLGTLQTYAEMTESTLGVVAPEDGEPEQSGGVVVVDGGTATTVFTLSPSASPAEEGSSVIYTVTADQAVTADTTLTFEISSAEATLTGDDFTTSTIGTVTIVADETTGFFSIGIKDDDGLELPEHFTVTLTDASGDVVATLDNTIKDTGTEDNVAPTITTTAISFDENQVADAVVGTITSPDTDVASYAITGGNDAGYFAINETTGAVSITAAGVAAAINDAETDPDTMDLEVTLTDNNDNFSTGTVTVTVKDVDDVAPTLQGTPSISGNTISMAFDEDLAANTVPGSAFSISHDGGSAAVSNVAISGNTVTLTLAVTPTGTVNMTYTPPASNPLEDAIGNDVATFTSSVLADTSAPSITTLSPADAATSVSTSSDIVLTFDENVVMDTGSITITNPNDAADTRTITITGGAVAAGSEGTVTVNGSTVTINLTDDLLTNVNYTVAVANGTFADGAENDFAGGGIPSGGYDFSTQSIAAGTFTLTQSVETLSDSVNTIGGVTGTEFLTSSNNVIDASLVTPPAGGASVESLQSGDLIADPSTTDADVLNLQFFTAGVTVAPRVTNVETINITTLGAGNSTLSASNITGTTAINYDGLGLGIAGAGLPGTTLTLNNLQGSPNIGWDTNDNLTMIALADAAGDSITIDVDGALAGGVTLTNGNATSEYDTVNLGTTTQATLDFTYALNAANAAGTTLAVTGNANTTVRAGEAVFTPISTGGNGGILSNAGSGTMTLRVTDDGGAALGSDWSALTTVDTIYFDANQGAEAHTILASQSLLFGNNAQAGIITANYSTADQAGTATALNASISGVAIAGVTAGTGIEVINITSAGTAANTLNTATFTDDPDAAVVNVLGSQQLTITTTGANADRIDASTYNATAATTQGTGLTINGAGADMLRIDGSASAVGDVVDSTALDVANAVFNANGGFDIVSVVAGTASVIRTSASTDNNSIAVADLDGVVNEEFATTVHDFVIVGTQAGSAPVANGTANSTAIVATGGIGTLAAAFGADNANLYLSMGQADITAAAMNSYLAANKTLAACQTAEQTIEDQFIGAMNGAATSAAAKTTLSDGDSAIVVSESATAGTHCVFMVDGQSDGVWEDADVVLLGVIREVAGADLVAGDFLLATS